MASLVISHHYHHISQFWGLKKDQKNWETMKQLPESAQGLPSRDLLPTNVCPIDPGGEVLDPGHRIKIIKFHWVDLGKLKYIYLDPPSGAKWMGVGVPLSNPLGFKHHLLKGDGNHFIIQNSTTCIQGMVRVFPFETIFSGGFHRIGLVGFHVFWSRH